LILNNNRIHNVVTSACFQRWWQWQLHQPRSWLFSEWCRIQPVWICVKQIATSITIEPPFTHSFAVVTICKYTNSSVAAVIAIWQYTNSAVVIGIWKSNELDELERLSPVESRINYPRVDGRKKNVKSSNSSKDIASELTGNFRRIHEPCEIKPLVIDVF